MILRRSDRSGDASSARWRVAHQPSQLINNMQELNTLKISSAGGKADYRVEFVDGIDQAQSELDDHDEGGDHHVDGHVYGGEDIIVGQGPIRGLAVQSGFEHASLRYNGRPVAPFHLNQRKLTIETPEHEAPYTVCVEGEIVGSSYTNWNDRVYDDGRMADGEVTGGTDVWYIVGMYQGIDTDSILDADLDGKDVGGEGTQPCGLE